MSMLLRSIGPRRDVSPDDLASLAERTERQAGLKPNTALVDQELAAGVEVTVGEERADSQTGGDDA